MPEACRIPPELSGLMAKYRARPLALPYLPGKWKIVGGRRCKLADKWKHRKDQEPYDPIDYMDAAVVLIDKLESLVEADRRDTDPDYKYFEEKPKIVGVWGTGSGPAGRYTKRSDLDVWIQVEGLTHQGEKYVDQDILTNLEEHGIDGEEPCAYAAGECRKIDVIVLPEPPDPDYCSYRLDSGRDANEAIEEAIEKFNARTGRG